MNRANWDHTFSPTIVNNFNYGYLDFRGINTCVNQLKKNATPGIPGVMDHATTAELLFSGFYSYGASYTGTPLQFGCTIDSTERRPTNVVNDLLSWVRGKHTLKFGGEYRALELSDYGHSNSSGTFNFSPLNTGLLGVTSGNAIASFLLGEVGSASASFYTVDNTYKRGNTIFFHAGDTWKVTRRLTVDYGIRWDRASPAHEKYNHLSFFDPVGLNPGAGNRPGRLAFAGIQYGAASFGRREPEQIWNDGFAPRLGMAYSLSEKTVVRGGYGIFYTQNFYPGWNAGNGTDGFNANPSFSSSDGGMTAPFLLSQGFPSSFPHPPFINSSFDNGQAAPIYRPFNANRLPYAQQWNLTIEHQFRGDFHVSAAYVGNKGTRLPANDIGLNALNPSYLSLGQALYDQFQPGQTVLDGVQIPYSGWVQQMTACPPTVAQALVPYPQYCGSITAINPDDGNSTYHSFQLKAEKRYGHGVWLLGSYTNGKLLTDVDHVDQAAGESTGATSPYGVISPFQRKRNKALSDETKPR